jgi:hypothetical protein
MGEPFRNELGDTMPPEGSEKRRKLRERVDALLRDLEDFGRLREHPLLTRPFIDPNKGALLCLDCEAMFEPDTEAGHTRNACPRCAGTTAVQFIPKPLGTPTKPEHLHADLTLLLKTIHREPIPRGAAIEALYRLASAIGLEVRP